MKLLQPDGAAEEGRSCLDPELVDLDLFARADLLARLFPALQLVFRKGD